MEYEGAQVSLFEVSWEVCNKVGGIYAVVSSKALQAVEEFGEEYYMLGPDLKNNAEFEETDEPCWDTLRIALGMRNLKCRFGRWNIPGRPKVILVSFRHRFNQDQLLYELWNKFKVDSLSGGWDYVEPVMFSSACAEVITAAYQTLIQPQGGRATAHFHEWMCGAGLLGLKKLAPGIGTVFTTHATVLGRSMAGSGVDIYRQMKQIVPTQEAAAYNVTAKSSMESISALEADCFTTVSGITAEESGYLLGRTPDIVTPNGLDMRVIPNYSNDRDVPLSIRQRLMEKANRFLRKELPETTRIAVISGRYEYHNKGIDTFIEALWGVEQTLKNSNSHLLAMITVMGGHSGVNMDAVNGAPESFSEQGVPRLSSHYVHNQPMDPIIANCTKLGLVNGPDNHVHVIFVPAMLDGHDGFLDMTYFELLSASDIGVFPSWYEPWGYTPQESAAYSVPTITTDLSGFGLWTQEWMSQHEQTDGVTILPRRYVTYDETVLGLKQSLIQFTTCDDAQLGKQRGEAYNIALSCSWERFFPFYTQAYTHALEKAEARTNSDEIEHRKEALTRILNPSSSSSPNLHTLTAIAKLPKAIERLRELANNLWWSWHPEAVRLFEKLNPEKWESLDHNPILAIEEASPTVLESLSKDSSYLTKYERVMQQFDAYMAEPVRRISQNLHKRAPIAYFSTEYGLHESLPIYSGGLGVLSGDHLKSASDLNIPLVAVGLLYHNGYFRQKISKEGGQIPQYPVNNFDELPLQRVQDESGAPIYIQMDLPGRQLFVQIWKVAVGRISLYLMDTDVPMNTADDRKITARLYEADRDYRIRQEILLGMGGVRMLAVLGITPSVYHMNEGHSAFMALERIRGAMHGMGLSLQESIEFVRSNTIFTTHTPVDAGNERFSEDQMAKYFTEYAASINIPFQDFMRLGRLKGDERHVFEMTVFALNMSAKSNGVSRLHGLVSRYMWQDAWQGVPVTEIPIGSVTNGVHMASYVGFPMRTLLEKAVGEDWLTLPHDATEWNQVDAIPDEILWHVRKTQKTVLFDYIRKKLPGFISKFGLPRAEQVEVSGGLDPNALIIGFARRFAPYKRATMLFADPDRLDRILNDPNRPVRLVFSGKAHPADEEGDKLIKTVHQYCRDKRFLGKIFFIEDYSLAVSRLMVQGCDVWLNTPRRPYEASGTSGQKVPVNGGLNLSISDGWWCEGQGEKNGWTIGPLIRDEMPPTTQSDYEDAESLYTLLEEQVLPLYFDRRDEVPARWLEYSRQSIKTLTARFSSHRMVSDYVQDYYIPSADRAALVVRDNIRLARDIAAWKRDIPGRFSSVKIGEVEITGIDDDQLFCGEPMTVQARIQPGTMSPEELLVELVVGPARENDFAFIPETVRLQPTGEDDGKGITFNGSFTAASSGRYVYGIRVMPLMDGLDSPFASGLILWA